MNNKKLPHQGGFFLDCTEEFAISGDPSTCKIMDLDRPDTDSRCQMYA